MSNSNTPNDFLLRSMSLNQLQEYISRSPVVNMRTNLQYPFPSFQPRNRVVNFRPSFQYHRYQPRLIPNTQNIRRNTLRNGNNFVSTLNQRNKTLENTLQLQKKKIVSLNIENKKPLSQKILELEKINKSLFKEANKSLIEHIKEASEQFDEFLMCNICYERYDDKVKRVVLDCGHIYCQRCLVKWFKKKVQCPSCKKFNPNFNIDNNYNKERKEVVDILSQLNKKINNPSKKRKRVDKIESPKKRQKKEININVKKFWSKIGSDNVRCNMCNRVKKKKNILKHWYNCPKNDNKPKINVI